MGKTALKNNTFKIDSVIYELFPSGLDMGACEVAGLPSGAWCWRGSGQSFGKPWA